MDLLKHSLPILQEEAIGVGNNNNTHLSRKSLVYISLMVIDII
jgi:hypothetical protein